MKRRSKLLHILRRRAKRPMIALLIGVGLLAGWSVGGNRVIAALNPALRHELSIALHPALDVWITPPEYAGASPIIISTPASILFDQDTIIVPEGSTLSAHLAEQEGDAPELVIDNDTHIFTADEHGDFAVTQNLTSGHKLSIERDGVTLGAWKIDVRPDAAPQVSLTEPPSMTSGKVLRIAYQASDAFGVADVAVRVTPRDPAPGAGNASVDIALPVARSKEIARVDFTDLTGHPWAGQPVSIQIVATNVSGQTSVSEPADFTLPERGFFHPVARVLIEERKKLLVHPDDPALREEAANIMAGIAMETADYHGDPVVLMALRSGAVRLILDRDHDTALSVNDLLWQAATRIEDGSSGQAQQMLRDARQDLADAVRRNATPGEIETLTDRLQKAMQDYMAQIATRRPVSANVPQGLQTQVGSSKVQ